MIDAEGYRLNVGIVIANVDHEVLVARRSRRNAWQFPQGGIDPGETPEDALWREVHEEVGLRPEQLRLVGQTSGWLHYRLPVRFLRSGMPQCVGQKQKWFLVSLLDEQARLRFDLGPKVEFDAHRWVPPERAATMVVWFKQPVYRVALSELLPLLGGRPRHASGSGMTAQQVTTR